MVPGAEHDSRHGHRAALALVCPSLEEAHLAHRFDQHIAFLLHTELQVNSPAAGPGPLQPHTFPPPNLLPGAAVEPFLLPVMSNGLVEF